MAKPKTIQQFIQEAIRTHENKYSYNQSKYINSKIKLKIYCKTCKKYFYQSPDKHLNGKGCPSCAGNIKKTTEQFIQEAVKIHSNKYSYDQTKYISIHKPVTIYCNNCNKSFSIIAHNHLQGKGCRQCSKNERKTTEQFIQEATKIHGNKCSYNQVKYINNITKIKIYCNICKEYFYQNPREHLKYEHGCKKCAKKSMIQKLKMSQEKFIQIAKEIHGNKYNYDKVEYINHITKIKIYCKQCKKYFEQIPNNHIKGAGCKQCAVKERTSNKQEFIKKAIKIHGNKYDYTDFEYIKSYIKSKIYCKQCNKYYLITPNSHLNNKGCPKCAINNMAENNKLKFKEFKEKAVKIHGDNYEYNKENYKSKTEDMQIYCKTCQKYFTQKPSNHLSGRGCKICSSNKTQRELYNYITELIKAEINNREIIRPQELDIWIPSHNLAIELNGLYYHEENKIGKNYHYEKYLKCKENNIKLIQIFENEWLERKNQVKHYIQNLLKPAVEIPGNITKITKEQYIEFREKYGIILHKPGNNILGYYTSELVAVSNFNDNILINYIESTNLDYALELMVKHNGGSTYIDNLRYSIIDKLANFDLVSSLQPDHFYCKYRKLYSKFYYPKSKFKNYDENLSAVDNMMLNSFYVVWDAGYNKYELTVKDK